MLNRPRWDNTWKSFYFEYVKKGIIEDVVKFVLKPESFSQTEPARMAVHQTKGGVFVDGFGPAIVRIQMSGTTGYWLKGLSKESGHQHFFKLRNMYRKWLEGLKENAKDHILRFHNVSDDESWIVVIEEFTLTRSVGRPLLYNYSIVMSGIERVDVKRVFVDEQLDVLDERQRVAKIVASLENELTFFDKVAKGIADVRQNVKEWVSKITAGFQIYSSSTNEWIKVGDVVEEVRKLTKDLSMYSKGIVSIVNRPMELVRSVADKMVLVIDNMVSGSRVPHELVRSWWNMVCAIKAVPEAVFKGFMNPELFEGVSNCGTLWGIKPSQLEKVKNSFSATAGVTEKPVKVVFRKPDIELVLPDEPWKVEGVYLESDVGKVGLNYLDSYTGRIVRLASVPKESVIVYYTIKYEPIESRLKLKSARPYIIKLGDTLPKIALDVYGNADQWKLLAVYNNLEYPFIVDDLEFIKEYKARGWITIYRKTGVSGAITIPKGFKVFVPEGFGTEKVSFFTTKSSVIPAGIDSINIEIEAELAGDIGNVGPMKIVGFDSLANLIGRVENKESVIGGKIWKVLMPGDMLFVPRTEAETAQMLLPAETSYESLFGVDLLLVSGELVGGVGVERDYMLVGGVKNLVQALRHRLLTERKFYPYHPNYGTYLNFYLGKGGVEYYDIIRMDVRSAVLDDPRIESIKSLTVRVSGDIVNLDFDVIPINEQSSIKVDLVL